MTELRSVSGPPTRPGLPRALAETGVLAVLRAPRWSDYEPVVAILVENGVLAIELTMTTPHALRAVGPLRSALHGTGAELGLGTVQTVEDAKSALDAGVDFIVTPVADPDIVAVSCAAGVPVLPGALTPTEILRVWSAGASAVKVFPASTVTSSYIRHLHGPFPGLPLVPSGGYGLPEIPEWIEAGAVAISLGSALTGRAFAGDHSGLADRAARAVDSVRRARAARPDEDAG